MWTPRPLTKTEQELEDACAAACAAQSVDAIEMAAMAVRCGADEALTAAFTALDGLRAPRLADEALTAVYNALDPATMEMIDDEARQKVMWLGQLLAPPVATDDDPLADLFDTLRRLLPGTNADGSPLSDADLLARAVDEIITLRTDTESAAWHDVATEPPPLRCDVLFANDYRIWVGEAREVTFMDAGKETTEIAYYEDGDFSDGVPPVVWATLPVLDDPADPGLDAGR